MSGKVKENKGFSFDFINTHQSDSRELLSPAGSQLLLRCVTTRTT